MIKKIFEALSFVSHTVFYGFVLSAVRSCCVIEGGHMRKILTICAILVFGVSSVKADDINTLRANAAAKGPVTVIVTDWQALDGNDGLGNDVDPAKGMSALDGNDFIENLKSKGASPQNVRRFKQIPVLAMTVDAQSLEVLKASNDQIKVWEDKPIQSFLRESNNLIGVPTARKQGLTGKGTVVAIIDDGIDRAHPFFQGRVIKEACFAEKCPNNQRSMVGPGAAKHHKGGGHGTHVAGIALGKGSDFSGVASDAQIIAVNVFNAGGSASFQTVLAGLDWVIDLVKTENMPVAAVNMSLGAEAGRNTACNDSPFYVAMSKLYAAQNVPVVVASGNGGNANGIGFPACVPGFISVGAVDKTGAIAPYSNSAPILNVLGPGGYVQKDGGIVSAIPGGGFEGKNGTSMAAPHVAGGFAVLRQLNPSISVASVIEFLERHGGKIRDSRNKINTPIFDIDLLVRSFAPKDDKPPKVPSTPGTTPPSSPSAPDQVPAWQSL